VAAYMGIRVDLGENNWLRSLRTLRRLHKYVSKEEE
jgi:hypothetical protein